jgi:hypothetical protein
VFSILVCILRKGAGAMTLRDTTWIMRASVSPITKQNYIVNGHI